MLPAAVKRWQAVQATTLTPDSWKSFMPPFHNAPKSHPPAHPISHMPENCWGGSGLDMCMCVREWVDRWITVFPRPLFAFLFKTACVRHTQKAKGGPRTQDAGRNLPWPGLASILQLPFQHRCLLPRTFFSPFSFVPPPGPGPGPDAIGIFCASAVLSRGISFSLLPLRTTGYHKQYLIGGLLEKDTLGNILFASLD